MRPIFLGRQGIGRRVPIGVPGLVALAIALLIVAPVEIVSAHGISIGRSAAGQLRIVIEVSMPAPIPPSIFPGITGWANAEPGLASAELDEPAQDLFQLDPGSDVEFELVAFDPGIQIVTSHVWVPGETLEFGPPVFDEHLVFDIYNGSVGFTYAIQIRVRDLSGLYTDSDVVTLQFTPVTATCPCRGDVTADHSVTGTDIQAFVTCLAAFIPGNPPSSACTCADMNDDGLVDGDDIDLFANQLLLATNTSCP